MMKRLLCLYISAMLMIVMFTACGSSSSAPAPPASSAAYSAEAQAAPPMEDYGFSEDGSDAEIVLPLLTPSNAGGKKLVYTVTLWLQTTGFEAGTRKLLSTVSDMGGYVQSAYINGRDLHNPDIERDAIYTFRIPSENLSDFLVVMEDNFILWRLEQESQDITAKNRQTDTRLSDLLDQEKRLLETIRSTEDAREKLSLERQLADVQASISGLDASRVAMDDAVTYSTVTIRLYEVILPETEETQQTPFGERFSMTVNNSLNGFVAFCQGFLLVIITLAPAIVILAVFAAIIILIIRLWKKRGDKKKARLLGESSLPDGSDGGQDGQ